MQASKKDLWQTLLVLIEVSVVASVFFYMSTYLRPIQDGFDILERYILFIAIYEFLIYITLTFANDARRDSLLGLKMAHEQGVFYLETNAEFVKGDLLATIAEQLKPSTFNHLEIKKSYENLLQYIEAENISSIKYELLNINHSYEMCNLQWKFTFFLRLFK